MWGSRFQQYLHRSKSVLAAMETAEVLQMGAIPYATHKLRVPDVEGPLQDCQNQAHTVAVHLHSFFSICFITCFVQLNRLSSHGDKSFPY